MKLVKLLGIAGASLLAMAGAAHAQGMTNSLPSSESGKPTLSAADVEIVIESGFQLEKVVQTLRSFDIDAKTVSVPSGQAAVVSLGQGLNIVLVPELCEGDFCLGLLMMTFMPARGVEAVANRLNQFNSTNGISAASYDSKNNQFVLMRMLTNYAGITRGTFQGEVGAYIGTDLAFIGWVVAQSQMVSVDYQEGASDSKIDNAISPNETVTVGSTDASVLYQDLLNAGLTEAELIYQPQQ